jgi:hypothetical protein
MRSLFIGMILSTSLLRAADVKKVVFILVDDLGKHDRGIEGRYSGFLSGAIP